MSGATSEGEGGLDGGSACVIVTGAPGAGKSTVSRLLAERLSRSALIDAFFVSTLVKSGYVWPLGTPAEEAARQVRLLNANLCALATNFAEAGFTPVLDFVLPDRDQFETFRCVLGPRRLLLIVLDPGTATCRHRNAIRPAEEQFFFDGYEQLHAAMHDGYGDNGWWFDTSGLTADETVDAILRDATRRAIVTA